MATVNICRLFEARKFVFQSTNLPKRTLVQDGAALTVFFDFGALFMGSLRAFLDAKIVQHALVDT